MEANEGGSRACKCARIDGIKRLGRLPITVRIAQTFQYIASVDIVNNDIKTCPIVSSLPETKTKTFQELFVVGRVIDRSVEF
jgi:hypothetical protein